MIGRTLRTWGGAIAFVLLMPPAGAAVFINLPSLLRVLLGGGQ